ncbi:hypothetical protein HNP38_000285 [Chryseobacterium defluvii]|uniref:Uncharacterized protein n=1 Tax=Chryseobacterium defluvii TaxID=160396 RepID=A0A840KBV2_9FLAO|nr:hypothetical protein [Chryseobacterium defluvii]MBB4805013.1 hypothetical protein [Chryseobacterium defluvii]
MKKIILMISFTLTLFLLSCTQDSFDSSVEKSTVENKDSNQYSKDGSNDEVLKANLKIFYDQNKDYAEKIGQILDQNPNFKGGNYFYAEINQAQNDEDIIQTFSKYGVVSNAQELLRLIKEKDGLSEDFSNSNPYLYQLDEATREQYINEIVQNDVNNESIVAKPTCYQQYQMDRTRCYRNYAVASVVAVASAPFTAGIVTAIVGGGAVAVYAFCLGDANEDYENCLK